MQPGDLLAGRYLVENVLGSGGMGAVVAARHVMLGERVAVKMLLPELAKNNELVARFQLEAQAAARVQSEHVCRVMDIGVAQQGVPFFVMEYLNGWDLARELKARGPLPIEEAIAHVLQASVGLAEAHSIGIVHRDLKPSNLFLVRLPGGRTLIKVLDFGIAKRIPGEGDDVRLTRSFSVLGSAAYMSPEQVRKTKDVDCRTDVWSLGIVLFELTTGALPFAGSNLTATAAAIASDRPVRLSVLRPSAPEGLEKTILACLQKRPEDRPQSLAELAVLLAPLGGPGARALADRVQETLGVSLPYASKAAPISRGAEAQTTAGGIPAQSGHGTRPAWATTDPELDASDRLGRWRTPLSVAGAILFAGAVLFAGTTLTLRQASVGPDPSASAGSGASPRSAGNESSHRALAESSTSTATHSLKPAGTVATPPVPASASRPPPSAATGRTPAARIHRSPSRDPRPPAPGPTPEKPRGFGADGPTRRTEDKGPSLERNPYLDRLPEPPAE